MQFDYFLLSVSFNVSIQVDNGNSTREFNGTSQETLYAKGFHCFFSNMSLLVCTFLWLRVCVETPIFKEQKDKVHIWFELIFPGKV